MKKITLCLILFLGLSIIALAQDASKIVVAKINDKVITLEEFNKEIAYHDEYSSFKIVTAEDKIKYLKEIIDRILFSQEALRRGLYKEEEIRKLLQKNATLSRSLFGKEEQFREKSRQDILAGKLIEVMKEQIKINPQEIRAYYDYNLAEKSKLRRFREIVVSTYPEAARIYIELLNGADFATLAKKYSKSFSTEKGGDTGFFGEWGEAKYYSEYHHRFYEIAFSDRLEVGKITPVFETRRGISYFTKGDNNKTLVFKTRDGFCILKLEAEKEVEPLPFNKDMQHMAEINILLLKEDVLKDDLSNELSQKAKVEIYRDNIK